MTVDLWCYVVLILQGPGLRLADGHRSRIVLPRGSMLALFSYYFITVSGGKS